MTSHGTDPIDPGAPRSGEPPTANPAGDPLPDTGPGHRRGKQITGYCEPWSLRAGDPVVLRASSHTPGPAEWSLVRIHCGDPTRSGPGFLEEEVSVPNAPGPALDLVEQPLRPGSYGTIDLSGLSIGERFELSLWVLATRPSEPQTVATVMGASMILQVVVDGGLLRARAGGADLVLRTTPLANRRWYRVEVACDLAAGLLRGRVTSPETASPGRDLVEPDGPPVEARSSPAASRLTSLILGGTEDGGHFDGRLARPELSLDGTAYRWDFSRGMNGPDIIETTDHGRPGVLHQLPARAVTGPGWDGTEQRWTDAPEQWDAVHFHKDDLYDAGWQPSVELTVPRTAPSGIYAFRVRSGTGDEDRVPFFVRPAAGAPTADVALLMSSATYLAYANHRMLFEGADFIAERARLRPEHEYLRTHPEVGRSMYERHPDGSGVMFSSRLRPVLNLRPGADGWNFTPDTDINAFLHHHLGRRDVAHDVIADEDVHHEGLAALAPYRVLVTCSHPEYWSTAMLDALAAWQRQGGRLMYLGGNGFYWRVAFSDGWPGAMELRRAEDGVRNWETENGENYHAFSGEYGGMWRRLGRAPNELVGIGFAAQGFERASFYKVADDALEGRASWIWEGVEIVDGRIGTSGLGGGAAGQELDRYDTRLGSPDHAVVLASATEFGPDMLRTKEEFGGTVAYPTPDPYVRADLVFYETPNGGAVFSVGSISWFGALARNGYDNDIAKVTGNVLDRFLDPTPFEPPR